MTYSNRKFDRRSFIKKGAKGAAALAFSGASFSKGSRLSVGVVGGGIVGAATAYYLAKAGAKVTIFEKKSPASGATGKSFGLLSVDPVESGGPHYENLRFQSLMAYKRIDEMLDLGISWGGIIHCTSGTDGVEYLRKEYIQSYKGKAYAARMIDKEQFSALASDMTIDSYKGGIYSELDGHIDPVKATQKFLEHAIASGARLISPCAVTNLKFNRDKFVGVATSKGDHTLDRLIIAGGVDTPLLSAQAGFLPPLRHDPGILAHTMPTKLIAQPVKVVACATNDTWVGFKQYPDGRIVVSDSHGAPDIPAHHAIRSGYAEMPDAIRIMHGKRILNKLAKVLPQSHGIALDKVTLGFRPMPVDKLPIVGFVPDNPDVYVAVMHFGVTLAPLIGQYISQEILTDVLVDGLSPYRPNRFKV